MDALTLRPLGFVRSPLTSRKDAPRQPDEGAPEAWVEIDPVFVDALLGMQAGDDIMLEIKDRLRLRVAALEAIDGTPVIDIKPVLGDPGER